MKFGVTIPNSWGVEDVSQVIALGRLAEELGYDSVWTMDHLFNIGFVRTRLDDKPYYHPLATLTYLSAVTTRISLGTSVLVLPYHNPIELAKYAATLDHLSKGRVILGVGAGAMVEEFGALGIPLSQRGWLTNEAIRVMKVLWTSDDPEYHSREHNFEDLKFSPKPVQSTLPLWVGGASAGAMKRAALLGNGWHPNGVPAADYQRLSDHVRDMAVGAGRDPSEITMSLRLNLTGDLADNMGLVSDIVRQYEDAGVEHIVFALESGDIPKLEETMHKLIADVVPALR
jgi:probable F420-dependent oxidoreductase